MQIRRYGWRKQLPDIRDIKFKYQPKAKVTPLPASVDLRFTDTPRYDQGQLGSCHDDKTEVLTSEGWKRFAVLNGLEKLASVNPKTREVLFELPSRLIRFSYDGNMVVGFGGSIDFCVTPDHKMLIRKWNEQRRTLSDEYQLVAADEIGWYFGLINRIVWNGSDCQTTFTLKGVSHTRKSYRSDKDIPMDKWLRFLGIYLAEGTLLKRDQRTGTISYKIQIAASKEREKNFVRQVLSDIGVCGLELSDRFTFCDKRIYETLSEMGLEGVKAPFKFVPAFVFYQPADMIKEFLLGHFNGDGCEQNGHRSHYTSSFRLADDLQTLIFLSGEESYIGVRPPRNSVMKDGRVIAGKYPEYRISICEIKNLSVGRIDQIRLEKYNGDVFCAEMPTHHTLITRRGGRILVSGNCTANAINAGHQFDQVKLLLPSNYTSADVMVAITKSFVPSRLFVYYNERAMEGNINEDAGANIRDGIKSVANLGVCRETIWPYDIDQFRTRPSDACYVEALKHQVESYHAVDQDLNSLKSCLAEGYPIVFGFSVYESFESDVVTKTGVMPMPLDSESMLGGHAVMCVGYDDAKQWFIIRNSWGEDWGDKGYFYMPYAYITNASLASDFWTIRTVEMSNDPQPEPVNPSKIPAWLQWLIDLIA